MPRHDSRHGRRFATVEVTAATLYEAVAQGLNITERVQRRYRVHQRDSHILSMIHSLNERVQPLQKHLIRLILQNPCC